MNADSSFKFLPQGALIQEFNVSGHNIILGFRHPESYRDTPFFGETIGRVANRIKNGVIDNLNGRSYQLPTNDGPNHLHGGEKGWGKRTFSGPELMNRNGKESVKFTYVSPDGDEGHPGTVEARIWYTGYEEQDGGVTKTILIAEYEVELIGQECEETVVNVTNHTYFNLSGSPTIDGTECIVKTSKHLPIDSNSIPTGSIEDYPGIQANKPFTFGAKEPEIDHCFILDADAKNIPIDSRARDLKQLIGFSHPQTGLHLEIYSTEPAFQFYTGQFVDLPASGDETAKPPRGEYVSSPADTSTLLMFLNGETWSCSSVVKFGELNRCTRPGKHDNSHAYKIWQVYKLNYCRVRRNY